MKGVLGRGQGTGSSPNKDQKGRTHTSRQQDLGPLDILFGRSSTQSIVIPKSTGLFVHVRRVRSNPSSLGDDLDVRVGSSDIAALRRGRGGALHRLGPQGLRPPGEQFDLLLDGLVALPPPDKAEEDYGVADHDDELDDDSGD